MKNGESSTSGFSFEIGKNGEIIKYVTEQSSDKNLDEKVLQVLKNYSEKWIPSQKAGEPVESKIFLIVRIIPQPDVSQKTNEIMLEKPYIWKVDLSYFGIVRTTTSSSSGNFPGSGGMRTR